MLERAGVQGDVDAIKAAVARGEVWHGPVRREDARVGQGEDEITRVGGVEDGREERWMAEQRAELERLEERRVAERREEVSRAGQEEPPAYEAPPPKYTP